MGKIQKEELELVEEAVWDIKKIIIGIVSIGTVVAGGYYVKQQYFPSSQTSGIQESPYTDVQGAHTEETLEEQAEKYSVKNLTTDVQKKINTLSKQVNNLSPQEVATSSPQVQKVLEDLKKLEEYPKSQAKEMCLNICKGL